MQMTIPGAVVRNLGLFVHLATQSVPDQFPHHGVSVPLGVLLHSAGHIAYAIAGLSLCDTFIKSLFGDPQQIGHFRRDLAYCKRVCRITVKPLHKRAAVHREDIALLQNALCGRYPVHDLFVDGHAQRIRKTAVTQKSGFRAVRTDELLGELVQLERRNARPDMFADFRQRRADQKVVLAQQLDLFRCL